MKIRVDEQYVDGRGKSHRIAGVCKSIEPINGQRVYWSSNGGTFTEDGKYVWNSGTASGNDGFTQPGVKENLVEK